MGYARLKSGGKDTSTPSENPTRLKFFSNNYLDFAPVNKLPEKIVLYRCTFVALSGVKNRSHPNLNHSTHTSMESIRQKQIGELLRRYFGMLLTEEGSNIYGRDKLVTVTVVRMTPDLLVAKIYVSVYGTENKQEVILELEDNLPRLRQALASKVGKQMRRVPELEFFLDDTIDEMYRVDALLSRVNEEDKNLGK